jgi:hypothetical protein
MNTTDCWDDNGQADPPYHRATIHRMADDDWLKLHAPAPPRQPTPGKHLWSLRKNGSRIDCKLRFHGESYGWEYQCLHDGELAYGQRFIRREGALSQAEAQRERLTRAG